MNKELNKKIMQAADKFIDAYLERCGGIAVLDRDDLTWLVHDALLAGWCDRPLDWNVAGSYFCDDPVAPSVLLSNVRDCDRWRDCDGDDVPRIGAVIRTWKDGVDWPYGYRERVRRYEGHWWRDETHWRPAAQGPGGEDE